MAEETGQERTEEATPKKLRESREKGQVPRSKELNSMALLIAASGGFMLMGEKMLFGISELLINGLKISNIKQMDNTLLIDNLSAAALASVFVVAPLFALLLVVTMFTPLGIGGWSFSMEAMSFKFEKISPIKGMGRIFSVKGFAEFIKVLAKFLLVSGVSAVLIWMLLEELVGMAGEPLYVALAHLARLCGWMLLATSSVLIIIALLDVPFQIWQHNKELKMTMQEVKDENNETEGRPEVKGRIRTLQYEMSKRRMMDAVPDADVIITNPTHYAVALRYQQNSMQAPVVVAKGADHIALQIRMLAEKHNVTIVSAPPLARALFASTELDQEIPAGLYIAVATIISYVFALKVSTLNGELAPEEPGDYPIPDELTVSD